MRKLKDIDFSNTPGVRQALRLLAKSLIHKYYIAPRGRIRKYYIKQNFNKTKRSIQKWSSKKTTKIPKIIHYIWVGGNKKPDSVYKYIESWRKYCPDYLIIEWNEKNYDITQNRYTREAYEAKKWAFVTDYMRLDILCQFGGVYVDSDIEIVRNIDNFLNRPAFTSFETGDPTFVLMPTGIMGAESGNTWIQYL
ncbi:MAG TPA: capsular polysaccharide synthesis protein, partial [Candidatus Saccharibacteria bacterium]|nr:capsular polysaccharide synthesis protein [Candidatus Saccharibacteria bacterium]